VRLPVHEGLGSEKNNVFLLCYFGAMDWVSLVISISLCLCLFIHEGTSSDIHTGLDL
jgi:hypothetical protein